MKRAVIWFLLSCKRCLRKGIFPLLLLLMPLAAFVAGRLSDKEEGEDSSCCQRFRRGGCI